MLTNIQTVEKSLAGKAVGAIKGKGKEFKTGFAYGKKQSAARGTGVAAGSVAGNHGGKLVAVGMAGSAAAGAKGYDALQNRTVKPKKRTGHEAWSPVGKAFPGGPRIAKPATSLFNRMPAANGAPGGPGRAPAAPRFAGGARKGTPPVGGGAAPGGARRAGSATPLSDRLGGARVGGGAAQAAAGAAPKGMLQRLRQAPAGVKIGAGVAGGAATGVGVNAAANRKKKF